MANRICVHCGNSFRKPQGYGRARRLCFVCAPVGERTLVRGDTVTHFNNNVPKRLDAGLRMMFPYGE